jgi:late competence protein required for DNA uptake (superfamily II DNA/RNA helicase)
VQPSTAASTISQLPMPSLSLLTNHNLPDSPVNERTPDSQATQGSSGTSRCRTCARASRMANGTRRQAVVYCQEGCSLPISTGNPTTHP